jgi:hypothetical protein
MEMLFKTHFKLFLTTRDCPACPAVPAFRPCIDLKVLIDK